MKLAGVVHSTTLRWDAAGRGSFTAKVAVWLCSGNSEPCVTEIPLPVSAQQTCGPGTCIEIELTLVPQAPPKPITEAIKIPPSLGTKPRRAAKRHGRGGLEKRRTGMK